MNWIMIRRCRRQKMKTLSCSRPRFVASARRPPEQVYAQEQCAISEYRSWPYILQAAFSTRVLALERYIYEVATCVSGEGLYKLDTFSATLK